MKKISILFTIAIFITSCSTIIPGFVPKQKGKLCNKPECIEADNYFWDQFHASNYDSIPQILTKLKAVYLSNSSDWKLAAHIGFTHSWALAERHRQKNVGPDITDHATLSTKYFKEAFKLCPEKEWRYYGFYASMLMADGGIHNDIKQLIKGYFNLKKAVRKYPEFNLFTAAYTGMNSPRKKDRKDAIEMLWKNVEACFGGKVDRRTFDVRKAMHLKEVESKMSTCWNTWIAPHNLEGFFMIIGDLELRNENYATALNIYKNATYVEEFNIWSHKEQLLNRIEATEIAIENSLKFKDIKLMSYNSCGICHQEKKLPTPENSHSEQPPLDLSLYLN